MGQYRDRRQPHDHRNQPLDRLQHGATPPARLIAEAEEPCGQRCQFLATTGAFNLGNVWVKSPFQDVLVSLELVGVPRCS